MVRPRRASTSCAGVQCQDKDLEASSFNPQTKQVNNFVNASFVPRVLSHPLDPSLGEPQEGSGEDGGCSLGSVQGQRVPCSCVLQPSPAPSPEPRRELQSSNADTRPLLRACTFHRRPQRSSCKR